MINALRYKRKIALPLLLTCLPVFAGCGPSQKELMARDHLSTAEEAYDIAKSNPCVETYARIPLMDAASTLLATGQAADYDEISHLAYLAEKKTRIAVATTKEQLAENDKNDIRRNLPQTAATGFFLKAHNN